MKATLEVINGLQADGIIGLYAIAGAVGATFYLEPAATVDIDILIALEKAPGSALVSLDPIYDYLAARGYRPEREYIVVEDWPVQFLPAADALDEEALRQAVEIEMQGTHTRVVSAEHLVAMALRTGRAKDLIRVLQFVESGVLDVDRLDGILLRHGLVEKWEQFGTKFLRGGR